MDQISINYYKKKYEKLYNRDYAPADSFLSIYVGTIHKLIRETKAKTILHYGAETEGIRESRKWFYDLLGDVTIEYYDPFLDDPSKIENKTYDGIICFDFLQRIQSHNIADMCSQFFDIADKFIFTGINTFDNSGKFIDGEPIDTTIRPPDWWIKVMTNIHDGNRSMQQLKVTQIFALTHDDFHLSVNICSPSAVINTLNLS
jgi:hypothetical protein